MSKHVARSVLPALCVVGTQAALACTASESGGVLPGATSQTVFSGASITGQGAFKFTCGGVVLSALAGTPSLKATIQPSTTGLTLKNGGNAIPYQIFSDPGHSSGYTGGALVVNLNGVTLLSLLNGAGGNLPLYIATSPGANIPAGIYTDTLQVTWTYQNICEGLINIIGLCLGVLNNGTTVRTLVVTLTVSNDCTITAPSVSFGNAPLVVAFPTVSQNISLVCTKGMGYTVGMSSGSYPLNGRRRMGSGAQRLEYDIFKLDNTVWGSTTATRADGPAVADGVTVQTIPYTARIYQDQTTPPVGTYSDTLSVDVSF